MRQFWIRFGRGAAGLLLLCVIWELVARFDLVSALFFPRMTEILAEAWRMYASGDILPHLAYTLVNFTAGFLLALLVGLPLGLFLGWKPKALQYVDPIVSICLATPVIVLVPLVLVIFGIFWQSKVAITTWAVFFPVLISMIAGVQTTDSNLVKVARSFRASDMKIIRDIVLPGALPTLVGGIRLGLARGLIGVLAAEFFGSPRGLGYLAFNYSTTFQPSKMFVAILTMAVIGVMLTVGMQMVQRHYDAWRTDNL
ncbi:MAG: ABC transporter permease subunit [Azospirillaceae bacterium]